MEGREIITRHSVLYTLAAGLVILWGFGFLIYSAGIYIHLLLVASGLIILLKMSVDKKIKRSSFQKDNIKGENPF